MWRLSLSLFNIISKVACFEGGGGGGGGGIAIMSFLRVCYVEVSVKSVERCDFHSIKNDPIIWNNPALFSEACSRPPPFGWMLLEEYATI